MKEITIEGELIVSNPLSNESKDITDSKTYNDWRGGNLKHYLQVVKYSNVFNTDDWKMNQISLCDSNEEINLLLDELFHSEPMDEILPNDFSNNHLIKLKHTWRTCNHSFYSYECWVDVSTYKPVEVFGDKPTLTGYFLRGGV